MVVVENFFVLCILMMILGGCGLLLAYRRIMHVIICIEIMMLSGNILIVSSSIYLGDIYGSIMSIFVLCLSAAEIAIGFALINRYMEDNDGTNSCLYIKKLRQVIDL